MVWQDRRLVQIHLRRQRRHEHRDLGYVVRREANVTAAMGRLHLHLVARPGLGAPGAAKNMIRTCEIPYLYLLNAAGSRDLPLRSRRRLAGSGAQRDFQILEELAIAGATDYYAELIPVGMVTEAFPDNGIGFSFATDHPDGFGNDDLQLIEAVLPAVSLAIVSDAEHTIAAGLLAAYLGSDVGRRVHAGVVERGSVESIRAVLWYARSYFRVMVRWSC
jgi:hypothetical protein